MCSLFGAELSFIRSALSVGHLQSQLRCPLLLFLRLVFNLVGDMQREREDREERERLDDVGRM